MLTISPQSRTLLLKNIRVEVPYCLYNDLATFESFYLPVVPGVTGALAGSTPYLENLDKVSGILLL
jgi:hypothetical protein